jgi:metal-responsive CopG/Arc/MetJ family transcriptional regulator
MQRTNIYLDEGQTAALDEVARDLGISRAELIRRLLDQALGHTAPDRDLDLEAIAASAGVLGAQDVGARRAGLTDARSRHLDQVARRAGSR